MDFGEFSRVGASPSQHTMRAVDDSRRDAAIVAWLSARRMRAAIRGEDCQDFANGNDGTSVADTDAVFLRASTLRFSWLARRSAFLLIFGRRLLQSGAGRLAGSRILANCA